jgi:dTMP kinase
MLAEFIRGRGLEVVETREPGGSPIGSALRALLLSDGSDLLPPTELLLYAAERSEHVGRVIRPALERGAWVVCDRYGDATRAYQAFGRRLPREAVEQVHALATGGLEPGLTLFLRLPVEEALARARSRNSISSSAEGRFEAEEEAFHRRVAEGYEALAREFPRRIRAVDGGGSREAVFERIRGIVEPLLDV